MKIDLTTVLNLVKPQAVELTLGKEAYLLKRLTIADVKAMEVLEKPAAGDDANGVAADKRCFAHAATLFVDHAPPQLGVDFAAIEDEEARGDARRDAAAVYAVINQVFAEQRSKTIALAQRETSRQIEAQRAM